MHVAAAAKKPTTPANKNENGHKKFKYNKTALWLRGSLKDMVDGYNQDKIQDQKDWLVQKSYSSCRVCAQGRLSVDNLFANLN